MATVEGVTQAGTLTLVGGSSQSGAAGDGNVTGVARGWPQITNTCENRMQSRNPAQWREFGVWFGGQESPRETARVELDAAQSEFDLDDAKRDGNHAEHNGSGPKHRTGWYM